MIDNFSKLTVEELDIQIKDAQAEVDRANALIHKAKEEKKKRRKPEDFLKTKEFKALVKEYKALTARYHALDTSSTVTLNVPVTFHITPDLQDVNDVVFYDSSLIKNDGMYAEHRIEAEIGKGKLKKEQQEAIQSGLTSFLEDSIFCEVVLDLVPGLKDKLNKLEEDMFALADKMGEHDVDKGWLREQILEDGK